MIIMKRLRFAHPRDIPALLALENSCFKSDRFNDQQFRYLIVQSNALVVVVEKMSKIIAYAVVLFRKNSSLARLYSIAVDPTYQKRGVALLIYKFVEHHTSKHCNQIRLEVRKDNRRAIHFYKKNGYQPFGQYDNFYTDGEDALRMKKMLHHMKLK